MNTHVLDILRITAGLLAGGVIGLAFGTLQDAALRRHEQLEQQGKLKGGWSLMPGAGARVAYLLLALVLAQIICPLLFAEGTQWWVSGGLVAAYGWALTQRLRRQRRRIT
jgi:hypothetical protein